MRKHAVVLVVAVVLVGAAACSSGGGSSPAPRSQENFCSLLIAFRAGNESLSDDLNAGSPAQASSAMKRIVGQAALLQKAAPVDIKPDVDTAATFITDLDVLLARFDYDINKVQADSTAVDEFSALNTDEVSQSLDQLRSYGDVQCSAAPSTTTA